MLSADNADIVIRDNEIPGLGIVLDPQAIVKALEPFLPEYDLQKAEITYIRYKPRMNCMVTYRLETSRESLDVYAKAHGSDASVKLHKARERKSAPVPNGIGRILLEDVGVIVSIFPNDSKLKKLRRLGDSHVRKQLFQHLFPDKPEFWRGWVRTLAYKPERRYVAQLQTASGTSVVLKFYTEAGYQTAYPSNKALASCEALQLAEIVGHSNSHYILAFEWLPGHTLQDTILNATVKFEELATVGAKLAELHAQEPKGLIPYTRNAEVAKLLELAERLKFLCPHLSSMAECLAKQLAAWLTSQPDIYRPIHGDFYAKQIIVSKDKATIVDLDKVVLSDPRADLGLFMAHMERDVLGGLMSASSMTSIMNALLEGYRSTAGRPLSYDFPAYTAIGLFQLTHHPFRRCEQDWAAKTKAILERVAEIIGSAFSRKPESHSASSRSGMQEGRNVSVSDPFSVHNDPRMPFLARALHPDKVKDYLKRMFLLNTGSDGKFNLLAIRTVRYKPGKRCLLEYDVEVQEPGSPCKVITILGKARARGIDTTTYLLSQRLWDTDFHSETLDGISVPQPIGTIPELHMWFQQKVTGTVATKLLLTNDGIELAKRISDAAHKIHKTNIPTDKKHTMTDELSILQERLNIVAEENPVLTDRINRVLVACHRLANSIPSAENTNIHRDFYADQVIVDGTHLYIVDFDLYCKGDPGLDIGNFIGHLIEEGLRLLGDPDGLLEQAMAMEERFTMLSGKRTMTSIKVYTILTLARHIYISTQFTDRRPFTEMLLQLCEEKLAEQGLI